MKLHDSFDDSIPVLTEVFQDAPVSKGNSDAPPPVPHNEADAGTDAEIEIDTDADAEAEASTETAALAHPDAKAWAALERRLSERILQQLQDEVDVALEQQLRERIEEALDLAMAGLTDILRHSVQQTIKHIVVRAVSEELRHLQSLSR